MDKIDLEKTWFLIAVGQHNSVCILDHSPEWEDYGIEFFWEDTFEIDPPLHLPFGAYRWTGFKVGYWDEDDSINIAGGNFTPYFPVIDGGNHD